MPGVGLEEGPVKGLGLQARLLREVSPEEEGEGLFPFLQVLQGLGVVLALVQPQGPVVGGLGPKEVPVDGLEKAQVVVGGGVGGKGHRPLRGLDGPGEVPGEVVGPAQVGPVEPVVRAEGEGLEEGLLGLLPLPSWKAAKLTSSQARESSGKASASLLAEAFQRSSSRARKRRWAAVLSSTSPSSMASARAKASSRFPSARSRKAS